MADTIHALNALRTHFLANDLHEINLDYVMMLIDDLKKAKGE